VIPRYFSFSVFCFAQVLSDCETAYYMLRGEYPIHRWMHTYVGATAVAAFCTVVGRPICGLLLRVWLSLPAATVKRYFPATPHVSLTSAASGAFIGTYSHVFLDSIMHRDVVPLTPWSGENSLYRVISVFTLHALCICLGLFGGWYFALRRRTQA
jgi:membrane-bound metal-dependent hydrolase YbcI (DUF457 family)